MAEFKLCPVCNAVKSVLEFSMNRRKRDGLQYRCKVCYKQYVLDNYAQRSACDAAYYRNNIEKRKSYRRQPHIRKLHSKRMCLYAKNNPDKVNAVVAKRKAARLKRTPKWLTKEHIIEIGSYYTMTKELQWLSNEPLHVDHVVPLQGENVSGLHVPWNLQILTRSKNCSKSNK